MSRVPARRERKRRCLRVTGWEDRFENNRSRALKHLGWVPIPNQLDDHTYLQIAGRENGSALFGAWVVCVLTASRCLPRGYLVRSGGVPHDAESLALVSRLPVALFAEAIPLFKEVGWLEEVPLPEPSSQELAGNPQRGAGFSQDVADTSQADGAVSQGSTLNGKEGNVTEEKGRTRNRSEGSSPNPKDESKGLGASVAPAFADSGAHVAVGTHEALKDTSPPESWTNLIKSIRAAKRPSPGEGRKAAPPLRLRGDG
jgi:hypothetical protein